MIPDAYSRCFPQRRDVENWARNPQRVFILSRWELREARQTSIFRSRFRKNMDNAARMLGSFAKRTEEMQWVGLSS